MAKKISSKDLFEQEDIFKGVRDSAEKTLISLNKINDEFKQTAATLKQSLGDAKFDSSDSIKKFTQATAEANKVQKQAIEIEKLKEQVRQQAIKSEKEQERLQQERIKTQKAEAQEKARLAKESEKAAKTAEAEASSYSKLSKNLNDLRKQYKDLAIQNQENTAEGQQLLKQITDLDTQLKKVDATVGQHQRNVGNYEGATANLKTELRALTRELMNMSESDPKFQEMAQRAGDLKDQIQDTQAVVKATAGSAMENFAGSVAKVGQIGVAAFQGIESSMVLLGVENEAVLQSMQRLQALAGLGDALKTLGGLGDMLTEIKAGFVAAASKMGLFTVAKEVDTAATIANTSATQTQGAVTAATSGIFSKMGAAMKSTAIVQGVLTAATAAYTFVTSAASTGLKLFRLALISTGIGAIVVGVGMLIANFDKLVGFVQKGVTWFTGLSGTMKNILSVIFPFIGAIRLVVAGLEELGIIENEQEKIKKKNHENDIKRAEATIKKQDEMRKAREKAFTNEQNNYDRQIKLAQAEGKSVYELTKAKLISSIKYQESKKREIQNELTVMRLMAEQAKFIDEISGGALSARVDELDKMLQDSSNELENQKTDLQILEIEKKKAAAESGSGNSNGLGGGSVEKTDIDVTRRIEDERLRVMDESRSKELAALDLHYKRKQEDAEKELENDKDKLSKLAALNTQAIESKKIDEQKINDKWNKIDYEKQQAALQDKIKLEDEQWYALQKLKNSQKEQELLDLQLAFDKDIEASKGNEELQIELTKKFNKDYAGINKKYADQDAKDKEEKEKDVIEKEKEAQQKRLETIEAFAEKTTEYFIKKSNEKIAQIDKEIAAAEKQNETLRTLAAEGNINAQQSLAENQRIIDQANLRKEKQLKKQQRIEAGLAIFKLFSANADKKNPLAKTIADTTGLLAFISSLPMFYDGTEDTGTNGKGVDGRGGFHAVLHPNERVVPKSLNEQIGSMSNEQLAKLAQEYQNGRLVSKSNANSSMELAVLASKLDTLTDVIKNKPETNIALGEITQSAMQIVESKRTGNTTIYNRFRVSK